MTVKEYITSKLSAFGVNVSDADLADIALTTDLNAEFSTDTRVAALTALAVNVLPQYLLRAKSVSENGFSISWDNDALLKYYAWLCNELGIEDTLNSVSKIIDKTNEW